jgi:drug/metabolite transporter (DMT)-like permease
VLKNKKTLAYLGLIFVIFLWGGSPLITLYFYRFYSPTVRVAFGSLTSGLAMLLIAGKRIRLLGRRYLGLAIPTGVCLGLADISQKIGLQYTTPTNYAFLENLSCVVVPIVMIILTRKKPSIYKLIAAVICLVGCFVLAGGEADIGFGIGEALCSLAGILYGVNIALTGFFAKKLYAPLYVFIHMCVHAVASSISAVVFGSVEFNGAPISPIKFEWNIPIILLIAAIAIVSNTLCWTVRTNAMKRVDPTVVAIMMPFSSVVTAIISMIAGLDTLSHTLVIGAVLVLSATVLSGLADAKGKK